MRIGYIWCRPIPTRETDTQQVMRTVAGLARAGVEVELLVPGSYRPPWRHAAWEAGVRAFYGVDGPFRLRRLWTVEPSPLEIERATHALLASLAHRQRYDLVHCRSRTVLVTCAALGQPVSFETYRRLGHDNPQLAAFLARVSGSDAVRGVVTHSDQARLSLEGAGFPAHKLRTIRNGYEAAEMEPRLDRARARSLLGLDPARPLVVYTGHVRMAKGMPALLDLAERAPDVDLAIVGGREGDLRELRAELARRRLPNVQLLGWKPASELPVWLYAADVLVVPPTAAPLQKSGRTVLPMKLFTYLAAGRPILAPALPDSAEVLQDGVSACLVAPDDPAAAVAGLRRLVDEPAYAARLAEGALAQAQGLSWTARGERLRQFFEQRLA